MAVIKIDLRNETATAAFGARLAPVLSKGDVISLSGDLGAGKSTLARGLIEALCGVEDAPSPTYTFVEIYETDAFSLWHFDLFRLDRADDVWELGFEEALNEGAALLEWPERIGSLVPPDALVIRLEIHRQSRRARLIPTENWRMRLAAAGIA